MALTQFTNLNFEDIKSSIKDYLRENTNFSDFDFEGSNLTVIINLLAYNSYITAYNTNMVVNESFIDSATLRENIVSLARNIGYVPRSKRAAVAQIDYQVSGIATSNATITFEPGLIANSVVSDKNFLFSIPEKHVSPTTNGITEGTLTIFQGQYLEKSWTVDNNQPNARYILPNSDIDTSTLRVKVKEDSSSTTVTEYKLVDNIIGVTSTSNIYLIQETTDEKYELLFGDGIFGRKLQSGNIIEASYIKTDGKDANGANFFNFVGTISDENGANITSFTPIISSRLPAENGDDIETVQSIRNYAPRRYAAQNRAVTASDYEAILPSIYPNIESVSAYGGEDLNPPQFGRVFIAAKPRNGAFLAESTKKQLLQSLKNYSVAGIVPSFVNLKYLYVEVDSYVYYNPNFVGDPNNLKANVVSSITKYAQSEELNKFGGRFKYSNFTSLIDEVDTSITSNITTVRIRRNLSALINQFANYELCFDNEFFRGNDEYNIKSTGFNVSGIDGVVYVADKVVVGSTIGNLFLFTLNNNSEPEIVSTKFGTVNYETGELLIDTVNITSTVLPDNIIEIQAIPMSNDVLARKELYLQLDVSKSNFFMRLDSISSGANTSGTRYQPQSSYQNGKKTR